MAGLATENQILNSYSASLDNLDKICSSILVDLSGAGYSKELEEGVREYLSHYCLTSSRGKRGPAAGPYVSISLILSLLDDLPSELIAAMLANLLTTILKYVSGKMKHEPAYATFELKYKECDIVIKQIDGGKNRIELIDYGELLHDIKTFITQEKERGNSAYRVELPASVFYSERGLVGTQEDPENMKLWYVFYRDGERWPLALYDAENKCFIE